LRRKQERFEALSASYYNILEANIPDSKERQKLIDNAYSKWSTFALNNAKFGWQLPKKEQVDS
jgi:hypothetical protein